MPRKNSSPIPGALNLAGKLFPARPKRMLYKTWMLANKEIDVAAPKVGPPKAVNKAYVRWLKKNSMLDTANKQARKYSGQARLWQNPYAKPRPRSAVRMASVWYTAYPVSMITKPGTSILGTLADEALWDTFQQIGIRGLHTGPMKRAGGLDEWHATPSIDGHFDRISTKIDPAFGTEVEFRKLTETATLHDCIILDDIVPSHTGKGADFRLAEMNYGEYPGIYHMVEIRPADWSILPDVPRGKDSANISQQAEAELKKAGYIIGKLHRVMFYEPGVKETNWSATRPIRGIDGIKRRWVYLHYFKDGQPTINWLDPSFAGMKLVVGDALHSLGELGSKALRLDANGFLGIEITAEDTPAWSEGHPLSVAANHLIAGMVRKFGGFTFQELNLSIDDIKEMSADGADLSYDFVTRPAYHHALATGDTEFLRLMMHSARELGVDPASLVHALQNHDELTYELVHFWTIHKDDEYRYHDKILKGSELREIVREDLKKALTGKDKSYNLLFTENGIACTTVSSIAAVLGYHDITVIGKTDVEAIKKVHLLLAKFNAWQPGVFALSGWDLSGSLTLPTDMIKDLLAEGDTRWINRGAYDLMNNDADAKVSSAGMPKSVNLYGPLPEQLNDESSFASQLKKILSLRDEYHISTSRQVDIPEVPHKSMLIMVHHLFETDDMQITALNFSEETITGSVRSDDFPPRAKVMDMSTGKEVGMINDSHNLLITLQPYDGLSLLVTV